MGDEYKVYEPTYSHEQKNVVEHRFYIDDIINILMQMRNEGYRYVWFNVIENFRDDDESPCYAYMDLSGEDDGGYFGCDFGQIPEVPIEEINEYAFCGMDNPPYRMAIEYRKSETTEE